MQVSGNDAIRVLEAKGPSESFWDACTRVLGLSGGAGWNPSLVLPEAMRIKNPTVKVSMQARKEEHRDFESQCARCWDLICKRVFHEYGRRCLACGARDHVAPHHVIPRDETCESCGCGGPHTIGNLIPLCDPCHDYIECHESKPRTSQDCVRLGVERMRKFLSA